MNGAVGPRKGPVCVLLGTRPGIIMMAPVIRELEHRRAWFFVLHSGQHYSPSMDADLFHDFGLPPPDVRLPDMSGVTTHGAQTAEMLRGIEATLIERQPRVLLVGGDANTNLAGALAARKLGITVAHLEAGERSYDWSMPEEHNRRMIDHISELLFATNEKSAARLRAEKVPGQIEVTGNPIVDAARFARERAKGPEILGRYGVDTESYAILTLHRQENVDNPQRLAAALQGVAAAAEMCSLPVLFLVHPRTRRRLEENALLPDLEARVQVMEPPSFMAFTALLAHSRIVFTDSGGVQQEAYIQKRPCVTLRENTEWTETLSGGANRLAGTDPAEIGNAAREALAIGNIAWETPFGDGHAAARIVSRL